MPWNTGDSALGASFCCDEVRMRLPKCESGGRVDVFNCRLPRLVVMPRSGYAKTVPLAWMVWLGWLMSGDPGGTERVFMNRTRWYQSGVCCLRQPRFRRPGGETAGPKEARGGAGMQRLAAHSGAVPTAPVPEPTALAGYERALALLQGGAALPLAGPARARFWHQGSLFGEGGALKQSLKRMGFSLIPCASAIPAAAGATLRQRANHNKQLLLLLFSFRSTATLSVHWLLLYVIIDATILRAQKEGWLWERGLANQPAKTKV